jgi:hypothetical protein
MIAEINSGRIRPLLANELVSGKLPFTESQIWGERNALPGEPE